MEKEIIKRLAPCGIDCGRCVYYGEGDIKKLSVELLDKLGSYDKVAEKVADFNPLFKEYPAFKGILEFFSQGSCLGCREGQCVFPSCEAKNCHKEKAVDFCFQCNEYPCNRNGYDDRLKKKWLDNNDRMKAVGVEQFYKEQLAKPRY